MMNASDIDTPEIAKFDPLLVQRWMAVLRPAVKAWLRSEVRGLDHIPPGGVLLVSNHSGGALPTDMPVFASDFYKKFGFDRPLYGLAHDIILSGPTSGLMRRLGLIRANRANAASALRSGGAVLVFPGSDYDAYRPSWQQNTINFRGRMGYVRTAIESGVPIVPVVSNGGQEGQLYLNHGMWLAKKLGIKERMRTDILPISLGLPFGLTLIPINLPLPTKVVTQVLEPIDIEATFGAEPDVEAVDAHVRSLMQEALNDLAAQRRFPVLG
ncbi:MAG TPA: lysophospholipid acyltransferase family protein [Mycobacterium sp.]|nr:lysophospholipid acyltransferase family protein [Mycobacterium sp.]